MAADTVFTLTIIRDGESDCTVHVKRDHAEEELDARLREALVTTDDVASLVLEENERGGALQGASIGFKWELVEMPLRRPEWLRSFLDLSTAHVKQEAVERLRNEDPRMPNTLANEYGFLVYAPELEPPHEYDLPEDLARCLTAARAHGCHYIMLDGDAPMIEGLPVYEW